MPVYNTKKTMVAAMANQKLLTDNNNGIDVFEHCLRFEDEREKKHEIR